MTNTASPSPYAGGGIPAAPAGTSPSTLHVWAIVGLFALQMVAGITYTATINWGGYMNAAMLSARSGSLSSYAAMYEYIFTPAYFGVLVFGFLVYAATIVLAYFDGRTLQARGVQRPFHWAFTFIPSYGSLVYLIGRSVVVHRRTGTGTAPMWTFLGIFVLGIVLSLVVALGAIAKVMNGLSGYGTYGY